MPVTKWSVDAMYTDFYYESQCGGQIHGCRWTPEGEVKAIVQIVHGIAERIERYDELARFLNSHGILVLGEDHMGHGQSISQEAPQGFFNGGWFGAVEDTCRLMRDTMAEFPGVPYFIYGHSMGSFMTRTILAKHPDCGLTGAIICGTGWQAAPVLAAGGALSRMVCKINGEKTPSPLMKKVAFGTYNNRIEHRRTVHDWLTRDNRVVDLYEADTRCGFTASAGLMRDMMEGIGYIQDEKNLANMNKALPVYFIAGGDDPVGDYGKGVEKAAEEFRKAGMEQVDLKIYPLCRHEIHGELNRAEVFSDVLKWLHKYI